MRASRTQWRWQVLGLLAVLLSASAFGQARFRPSSFESAWKAPEGTVDVPSQGEKSWTLPTLPPRSGKAIVLRFHAVLKVPSDGVNNCLSIQLNGAQIAANIGNRRIGLPRLLNYSMKYFMSDAPNPSYCNSYFYEDTHGGSWLCMPLEGTRLGKTPDTQEVGWYLLDISDLTVSPSVGAYEQNLLTFKNAATPTYWAHLGAEYKEGKAPVPLEISSLEAGYLPLEAAERAPLRRELTSHAKVTPRWTLTAPEFSLSLTGGGGLMVQSGTESYRVESEFSYPNMPQEKWNSLAVSDQPAPTGEWKFLTAREGNGFKITASGKNYQLQRVVTVEKNRYILIKDTIINLTKAPLGVAFENKVTPANVPADINVSGPYKKTFQPYAPENPAWNPTIFFSGNGAGLGMVALDDFYRLQLGLKTEGVSGSITNSSFGLPGDDRYTFIWALYPIASADYYDFINKVRADWVPSCTIEGSAGMMAYTVAAGPREPVAAWLRNTGTKLVILGGPNGGAPWLGGYAVYNQKVGPYNLEEHLAGLKKGIDALHAIDPTVKCLVTFETPLTPDLAAGDTTVRFPDSVSISANGAAGGYRWPEDPAERKKFLETSPHMYVYYPTLTNSYYAFMKSCITRALKEAGADGVYFDLFSYAYNGPEDRWTYDRWDNRTVDMDMNTYTIKRTKADICKVTEEARAEIVKMILGDKKGNVVIANDMGMASKVRELPVFHFSEGIADYGYVRGHFSTPIGLGFTGGYIAGAKYIGKEGAWWQDWKTDKDYFEDVKDKLRSGCLYYTYLAPPGVSYLQPCALTRPTILSRMYPITIEELHAGCIKGKERIITLNSGTYSWGDESAVTCYLYDAEGRESVGTCQSATKDHVTSFTVEVPPQGAAALVRNAAK